MKNDPLRSEGWFRFYRSIPFFFKLRFWCNRFEKRWGGETKKALTDDPSGLSLSLVLY